jgi:hypothetical protein
MAKKKEPAENQSRVKKPHNWDKVVSAAYLLATGDTQGDAAKKAGCSVRSLRDWMKSDFWQDAWNEAKRRWLHGAETFARRGIMSALVDKNEYAQMSRWVGERLIDELAPPTRRNEHTGKDGAPLVPLIAETEYVTPNPKKG